MSDDGRDGDEPPSDSGARDPPSPRVDELTHAVADRKRTTAAAFDGTAESYRESDAHRSGRDLAVLADWCRDADRALDVATGPGHTAGALVDVGVERVIAADASPTMVATATGAYDVSGVVTDAERLPFAEGSVDAVTCRIAAHHFPDPVAFVEEVARVLAPGGTFAFEDNVAPPEEAVARTLDTVERTRDPTHVESHPTQRWRGWFEWAGLVVHEVRHRRTRLAFDDWVDRFDPTPDRRERVERMLLDAPADVRESLRVETVGEGGDAQVVAFANLKALVRAERVE